MQRLENVGLPGVFNSLIVARMGCSWELKSDRVETTGKFSRAGMHYYFIQKHNDQSRRLWSCWYMGHSSHAGSSQSASIGDTVNLRSAFSVVVLRYYNRGQPQKTKVSGRDRGL